VGYNVFATTGSNQFNGSQAVTGSLTVTGQVVAQTLNVQQVTSSIVYSSGSNIFGNNLGNTQQFTGSVSVTGSLTVNGAGTFSSAVTSNSFISDGTANEGVIRIERDTVSTNTVIGALNFTNNNGATVYGRVRGGRNSAGDGYVSLGTGVGENLYALEGGNVGIGITNPGDKLVVNGNIGATDGSFASGESYSLYLGDKNAFMNSTFGEKVNFGAYNGFTFGFSQNGNLTLSSTWMTITSTGNIGIGTAGPTSELEISKVQSTGPVLKLTNPNTENTSQDLGVLGFVSGDQSTGQANLIRASVKGIAGELAYGTGGQLVFSTMQTYAGSGTLTDLIERMRITSTGEVSISGTSLIVGAGGGAGTLNLDQSTVRRWKLSAGGITSGVFTIINGSDDSPALNINSSNIVSFYLGGGFANQTTLDANTRFQGPNTSVAAAKAYAWNTYSDQRIKENINPLSYGLNEILQLNPVSYNQYDSEVIDGEIILKETYKSTIGLIAQEVNNLIPEAVGVGNDTELWGLDYDKIVPVLVKAIQELKSENDNLKSRLEVLEQS
jgi:hypothetical protein